MNIIALNSEVTSRQLKHYADAVCFSQVGLNTLEISVRLNVPEHLISAWIKNWRDVETAMGAA